MPVDLTVRLRNVRDTERLLAALQDINLVDSSTTSTPVLDFDATAGRDISCQCCGRTHPDMLVHEDHQEIVRAFNVLTAAGVRVLEKPALFGWRGQ